jgi:glutathione synthase/RimK-type ligase-like ATP-grasp enzyme
VRIAIQPDLVRQPNGEIQSFSERWIELAGERGVDVELVDVFAEHALEKIARCDGFMWRYGFDPVSLNCAKRLLSAVEHGLSIPVFPDHRTAWHFEDKIAQAYLLEALKIPTAATRIFWDKAAALRFCREAAYPFVAKLSVGIRGNNVVLVRSEAEARAIVARLFGRGVRTLREPAFLSAAWLKQLRLLRRLWGKPVWRGVERDYLLAQDFLPDNPFDIRVTVIGERAYAFKRMNRPEDFRASGSGRIIWDPGEIPPDAVAFAFDMAERIGAQSVAFDILRAAGEPVVTEISYTFAAWAIRDCPGHWKRAGEAKRDIVWVAGPLRAEDAIFEDFVASIEQAAGAQITPLSRKRRTTFRLKRL